MKASPVEAHARGTVEPSVEVTRVWWQGYRIPYRHTFVAAHGSETVREGFLIGVEARGQHGVGDAAPLTSYAGGTAEEAGGAIETLAQWLIGRRVAETWTNMPALGAVPPGAGGAVRCGFETAAADLLSRCEGVSLAAWLRQQNEAAWDSPLADGVAVNATIDAGTAEAAVATALAFEGAGFRTLKLKVGTDPKGDLQRVRAVRDALGPDIALRIDANGAWAFKEAAHQLQLYEECGVTLCEQPISARVPGVREQMALLRRASSVLIAADESCRSEDDVAALLSAGAADVLVIKPMVAGLRGSLAMMQRAREARVPVIVTTLFESGVGVGMTASLASLLGKDAPACGLATLGHLEASLLLVDPVIECGRIRCWPGPGAAEVDFGALAQYAHGPRHEVCR